MQNEALVSIVMPVYNTGKYVRESINSVLSQSYQNWELIIVDDCSPDNAKDEILSFNDSRIKYIRHEKNKGALETRNTAIREANGKYIAFLDSDDLWNEKKLEKQISFMQKNNYAFTCTNYSYIDEKSNSLNTLISAPKKMPRWKFMLWCWCGCLTVIFDVEKVGKTYLENYKMRDDWALWIKISKKEACHLLNENLASYRIREGSQSKSGIVNLLKEHYRIFRFSEKKCAVTSFLIAICTPLAFIYKRIRYRIK